MLLLGRADAALCVADDPAHGVAGGDRTGTHELLALLQGDVGDFAWSRIDLIKRATGEGIDLHGVDEAGPHGLNARGGVGLVDARGGIGSFGRRLAAGEWLQLSRQRQELRQLDDLHGAGGSTDSFAGVASS